MKKAAFWRPSIKTINAKWPLTAAFLYRLFDAVKGHFCGFLVSNIFLDTSSFCGFSMPFLLVFCFFHYVLFFLISESSLMFGLNRISVRSSFLGLPANVFFGFAVLQNFSFVLQSMLIFCLKAIGEYFLIADRSFNRSCNLPAVGVYW